MAHIHFIGAGQMAEAIIRAARVNPALTDAQFSTEDIDAERVATLTHTYALPAQTPDSALENADLVVIAVRPQDDIPAVAQLTALLGETRAIARLIPNTLTDTGYGYSGVTLNQHAQAEMLDGFFTAFGKVLYLEERLIDVFTGFGVAGPNYIYYFIESLTDAGVLAAVKRTTALANSS